MMRKSKGRLNYTPLPDATPESESEALAWVYKFILERHESKKAADPTGDRYEAKEDKDFDLKRSLPQ